MPEAIPLGRARYVQFLIYPPGPGKPRHETEAWTQEFRSPNRYGVGSVVRLGRLGVHYGRWTTRTPDQLSALRLLREREGRRTSPDGTKDGVRLIRDDEMNAVSEAMLRKGWRPPWWHWRRYLADVLPLLHRLGLVTVDAFAEMHWRKPAWWTRRRAWVPMETPEPRFRQDQVTEGWVAVPPVPKCGPACEEAHTYVAPCRWSPEVHDAAST